MLRRILTHNRIIIIITIIISLKDPLLQRKEPMLQGKAEDPMLRGEEEDPFPNGGEQDPVQAGRDRPNVRTVARSCQVMRANTTAGRPFEVTVKSRRKGC